MGRGSGASAQQLLHHCGASPSHSSSIYKVSVRSFACIYTSKYVNLQEEEGKTFWFGYVVLAE